MRKRCRDRKQEAGRKSSQEGTCASPEAAGGPLQASGLPSEV